MEILLFALISLPPSLPSSFPPFLSPFFSLPPFLLPFLHFPSLPSFFPPFLWSLSFTFSPLLKLCSPFYSNYCPKGTTTTVPCRAGSYGPTEKLESQSQCKSCDPGSFCDKPGLDAVSGNCSAGFYCRVNASVAEPPDDGTGR